MRYYKIFAALLLAGALAGCAEKAKSEESDTAETAAATDVTTTEITTASVTTTAVTTTTAPVTAKGSKWEFGEPEIDYLDDGSIDITFRGETTNIKGQNKIYDHNIKLFDFNKDSIYGVEVTALSYNNNGGRNEYFRYDEESGKYIVWKELDKVNPDRKNMSLEDDGRIFINLGGLSSYYKGVICRMDGYELIPEEIVRETNNGKAYFEYENDRWVKVKKLTRIGIKEEEYSTTKYPPYCVLDDNGLDVYIKDELIQRIDIPLRATAERLQDNDNDTIELERAAAEMDFDFDGYDDLRITEYIPENDSFNYSYYHFNTDTRQYEPWTVLNEADKCFDPYIHDYIHYWEVEKTENGDRPIADPTTYHYIYKWKDDGGIELFEEWEMPSGRQIYPPEE